MQVSSTLDRVPSVRSNLRQTNSMSVSNLERGASSSITSVYSESGDISAKVSVTGDIQLTLTYDFHKSFLLIHVHQCRNLALADTRKKRTDPYVKAYLLPDKTKYGKRKTKPKRNTRNPAYNETLSFKVESSVLAQRTLWVSVWHRQILGHNEYLGEVTIPLDNIATTQQHHQQQVPTWHTLKDASGGPLSSLTSRGELHVTLTFVLPEDAASQDEETGQGQGELRVRIHQAKELMSLRATGTTDAFCTGRLLGGKTNSSKQKTPVIKHVCSPQWNYELVFKAVSRRQLKDRGLELCVWDHDRMSNDFLGGTRLCLGTGKSGNSEANWNDGSGEEVSVWQAMLDRANTPAEARIPLRPHMDPRPPASPRP